MAECLGGTPSILIFWLFLDNFQHFWGNNWQGINISHRTIQIMIQWRKMILFDFHHIPTLSIGFKGEVQSRITHNFKRKSKKFPTDWCKNYANRIRNKAVVTFWNFTWFFRKTFDWPVLMNIQMSELVMSSPHNLSYILYMKCWKISYFSRYR